MEMVQQAEKTTKGCDLGKSLRVVQQFCEVQESEGVGQSPAHSRPSAHHLLTR